MKNSITFLEEDYKRLTKHLFEADSEKAAYLLVKKSETNSTVNLLVRDIIFVSDEDIYFSKKNGLSIKSSSFVPAIKKAKTLKHSFVFVHSHPSNFPNHSAQDDLEERKLFKTVYNRIENVVHGSLVFSSPDLPKGRIWTKELEVEPIEVVKVIGNQFRFFFNSGESNIEKKFFDRQIRAFGSDFQKIFSKMHIGIVGAGGTGSSVLEQLTRLGIGEITIADPEKFELSNVNRLYGSTSSDDGQYKVDILKRLGERIGLGTKIHAIKSSFTYADVVEEFKKCDIVFGCTDDEWGRSILTKFSLYYYVPVFDLGVRIDSKDGKIKSINGRVTTLMPGNACLFCRSRISSDFIRAESLDATNPSEAKFQRKEGYVPELGESAPSVIPFTNNIASEAVIEFLNRVTGFMGEERDSSELLVLYDQTKIRLNKLPSQSDCFCPDKLYWGRGDVSPLLDLSWR